MKKYLVFVIVICLLSCDFNGQDEDVQFQNDPVSGFVYDITTNQPLTNSSVLLQQTISNGLFSPPTLIFIGRTSTSETGQFYFQPTTARYLQLTLTYPDSFRIDNLVTPKYWERIISLSTTGRTGQKIGITPNAILHTRFITDSPLNEGETLSFTLPGEGSNYSASNQPPEIGTAIVSGNAVSTLSWKIKRNGKPEESVQDTVFVKAFSKREKVVRY